MPATRNSHGPVGNRLLAAVPELCETLRPHLETVSMDHKQVVYEPNGPIPYVYFPTGCIVSLVAVMGDHSMYEMATVGREGMIGLPLLLRTQTAPFRTFAQVPGQALRLEASVFLDAVGRSDRLADLMHRYAQALFNQVGWSAACNRAHSVEQRCARWLLMSHDRVASGRFELTQEFLGQMLGVPRPRVNRAAGALQEAGLIHYVRGQITVLDRAGLESASCECYGHVKKEYDRLLG